MSFIPYRAWINQPSTLQRFHAIHGMRCIVTAENETSVTVYFTEGESVHMTVTKDVISTGGKSEPGPRIIDQDIGRYAADVEEMRRRMRRCAPALEPYYSGCIEAAQAVLGALLAYRAALDTPHIDDTETER